MSINWKQRYQKAHELNFQREYPHAWKDGHYFEPVYPKVDTSNGLTTALINFITWNGYRAARINTMGAMMNGQEKQASGTILQVKRFVRSAKKGTADIDATIKGRSVKIEIKAGRDKPRPDQLKMQAAERKAGGCYEFIYTIDEGIELYDRIVNSTTLF